MVKRYFQKRLPRFSEKVLPIVIVNNDDHACEEIKICDTFESNWQVENRSETF